MIAVPLKALLPLAAVALGSVVVLEVRSAAPAAALATPVQRGPTGQGGASEASAFVRTAERSVDNSDPSQSAPATKELGLHSTLTLLSDQTAKDLFDSKISKAYYVIEALLNDDSSSGFAVTGLELRSADGDRIQLTPARLIALQMSPHRKLMPARLIGQEVLVPNSSGVQTWLFVEKNRLTVVDGRLPPGLQLFGGVSKVQFEMKAIQ